MSVTVSQKFESLGQDNEYIDHITVTNVPNGDFLIETADIPPGDGQNTRTINVQFKSLDNPDVDLPGGTKTIQTGMYVRETDETQVTVHVYDTDGTTLLASNTQAYSS